MQHEQVMSRPAVQVVQNDRVVLSMAHFQRVAKVLHGESGIAMPESKILLANSRLAKRLRVLGLKDFEGYCALVESREGEEERGHMLAALTTNVTRFYREPHHFDDLKTNVLLPLVEKAKAGERIRLWSAACSSGEEPYSMAMTLLSVLPDAAKLNVKILATDIDPNILARARAGIYPSKSLADIPSESRSRYFHNTGDTMQVMDTLKQLITFRELNLIRKWPIKGPFDAIFCRNVVIYFDDATQRTLWGNFVNVMKPNGRLFIGHSERVTGDAVSKLKNVGLTAYQKST